MADTKAKDAKAKDAQETTEVPEIKTVTEDKPLRTLAMEVAPNRNNERVKRRMAADAEYLASGDEGDANKAADVRKENVQEATALLGHLPATPASPATSAANEAAASILAAQRAATAEHGRQAAPTGGAWGKPASA